MTAVPAITIRRARSASRFTVAQLNFGRESLRDALKRDTKLCRWRQCPCSLAEQRLADLKGRAREMRSERDAWREQPLPPINQY